MIIYELQKDDTGVRKRDSSPPFTALIKEEITQRKSDVPEEKRAHSVVELQRTSEAEPWGLVLLSGGGWGAGTACPRIAHLPPGSLAHRSDMLSQGDVLTSVNGISTRGMRVDDVTALVESAKTKLVLDVEYEIPPAPMSVLDGSLSVCPKVIQIKLDKDPHGSLGFLLRGGSCVDNLKSRPLTVVHVRPGGPADREGTIKPGDRLIAVDNVHLTGATLYEAKTVLKQVERQVLLTIEYDVSVMDAVRNASGPVLVEIDRAHTGITRLGVTLTQLDHSCRGIVIESIRQASIAERCGALHVGDQILAIDGVRLELACTSAAEAQRMLQEGIDSVLRLEILPAGRLLRQYAEQQQMKASGSYNTLSSIGGQSTSSSNYPLPPIPPHHTNVTPKRQYSLRRHHSDHLPSVSSCGQRRRPSHDSSGDSTVFVPPGYELQRSRSQHVISHVESIEIVLATDPQKGGYGVTLRSKDRVAFVECIVPGGPADRSGVVQVGDRVLAINHQKVESLTTDDLNRFLLKSRPKVTLQIEFDVAESVIASSGTFTVKLEKKGPGLGITITAPRERSSGDPLVISEVRRGSIAHRSGTLQPGDKLLAIDQFRMESSTIEEAARILQNCQGVVQLRIRKDEHCSGVPDEPDAVVYTVEVARNGGPLGITISGTQEPFDPIIISGLTQGGLAERTGALHVGDRILAINGTSLRGKPLSEAILQLQTSGDVVTLKLAKFKLGRNVFDDLERGCVSSPIPLGTAISPGGSSPLSTRPPPSQSPRLDPKLLLQRLYAGTPIPSVDSAVESWDSLANLDTAGAATAPPTAPTTAATTPASTASPVSSMSPSGLPHPSTTSHSQAVNTAQPKSEIDVEASEDAWSSIREWQAGLPPACQEVPLAKSAPSSARWDPPDWALNPERRPSLMAKAPSPLPPKSNIGTSSRDTTALSSATLNSLQLLARQSNVSGSCLPAVSPSTPPPGQPVKQPPNRSVITRGTTQQQVASPTALDISGPSGFTYNPPAYTHHPQTQSHAQGGRPVNSDVESSDWTKVLEDLQTCGQSRLLRQIERNLQLAESQLAASVTGVPGLSSSSGISSTGGSSGSGMLGVPSVTPNKSPSPAPAASLSSRFDDLFGFQSQFQDEMSSILDLAVSGASSQGGTTSSNTPSFLDPPPRNMPNFGLQDIPPPMPVPVEVHRVTLFKDKVYDDFGFSISDGLFEKGIYVNRIRPKGPADMCGLLRPFDRILQINEHKSHNMDCCTAVPLVAASGDTIELIISRPASYCLPPSYPDWAQDQPWLEDAPSSRSSVVITQTL
ncbi:glutamate receptor-interacting protein 1-like isoform X3 [Varroa jacobsoni]|uniref:PDZ domain-containing protein n=1 Tax=Varroa destructor TaxID=109461 RepID=A0A7M7JEX8_VARDE|nr:glutamate receptor-interacting protein 1-like isoform X4 [Varroa destructor]XP_022706916.1 glutamate receptor-interacting protein 1-like isoform X3 [Varroa jacobsoni]